MLMATWSEGRRRILEKLFSERQCTCMSSQSMQARVPKVRPLGKSGGTSCSTTKNSTMPLTPPSPVGTCTFPMTFA